MKNFPLLFRYASFVSLILAAIIMIIKFDDSHQIYCFQFLLFMLMFANTIQLARNAKITYDFCLVFAYIVCIVYCVFLIVLIIG